MYIITHNLSAIWNYTVVCLLPQLSVSGSNVKRGWTGELAHSSDLRAMQNRMESQFQMYDDRLQCQESQFQQLNERMNQVQLTTIHNQQKPPVARMWLKETYISSNGTKFEKQGSLTVSGRDSVVRVGDMFQHFVGQQASLTEGNFPRMHWSTAELHIEAHHVYIYQ